MSPWRHSSLRSPKSPSTQPRAMEASLPNLAASRAVMEWRLGLKLEPDCAITRWNKPSDRGDIRWYSALLLPALWPASVTWPIRGEHCGHVTPRQPIPAHLARVAAEAAEGVSEQLERHQLVQQTLVTRGVLRAQGEEAQAVQSATVSVILPALELQTKVREDFTI